MLCQENGTTIAQNLVDKCATGVLLIETDSQQPRNRLSCSWTLQYDLKK